MTTTDGVTQQSAELIAKGNVSYSSVTSGWPSFVKLPLDKVLQDNASLSLLHVLVQLMLVCCTASMELLSKTMNCDGIVCTFISAWDHLLFGGEVCGRMEETLFCWYLDSWLDLLNCYVGDVDWWRRSCGLIAGCFK